MSNQSIPEYRSIPGFPFYRLGSDGSPWTCSMRGSHGRKRIGKWRRMRGSPCKGYLFITLCAPDGKRRRTYLHNLILEAFVGPRPAGAEARHLNDIKSDNRAENLLWGTSSQNKQDSIRNGIFRRGSRCSYAILDEKRVAQIKTLLANGRSCPSLGREFGVHRTAINAIKTGKNWKHVQAAEEPQCAKINS